jgi:chromosomal replication initiation ATPase DnaA
MKLSDYTTFQLEAELARRPDARERIRQRTLAACCQDGIRILHQVAESFGTTPADILGRNRDPRITRARRVAMAGLLAEGHTLTNVGRFFERDHTTVRSAVAKLRKQPTTDH